ncbi:MAG: hypothetical protein DME41_11660 [Verrucomicrobia bacterium]|nr:MAG: hypothetical protein DME41_11660 [Verrucomicrobiota bacterium]
MKHDVSFFEIEIAGYYGNAPKSEAFNHPPSPRGCGAMAWQAKDAKVNSGSGFNRSGQRAMEPAGAM